MLQLARVVSIAGHPFATMLVFAWFAGARAGSGAEAVLVAAAVIAPIGALVAHQRSSGRWGTVDASERTERRLLYVVAVGIVGATLAVALLRGESQVGRVVGAVLLLFAVAAAANRWLKTSLHVAFAAFGGAALLRLGSPAGWGLALLVPLLAWSRLALRRHTPREVGAGVALGVAAALVLAC